MNHDDTLDSGYPWEQLSLLQPDQFGLKAFWLLSARTDSMVCNLELRTPAHGELVGLQTFGGTLAVDSVAEVLAETARWVQGARQRLMPF